MKIKRIVLLSLFVTLALAACTTQPNTETDIAVKVAASLTQTAAAPKPAASPTPAAVNGTITGKVGLMAPPTPAMTVYALDPATGKSASVDTQPNPNGMADFSLSVPPGSYQVFAASAGGDNAPSAAYSGDGRGLTLVNVTSNQTVSNIMVQFPGQGDCGISFGIPASPDGKHKALPGPDPVCVNNVIVSQTAEAANPSSPSAAVQPVRVQFQAGSSSWGTAAMLKSGDHAAFVLGAMKGQTMTVTASFTPSIGAYFFVRSAGGQMLLPSGTSSWTTVLPATQDYVVGIDNLTAQPVQYSINITIPPAAKAINIPTDNPGVKTTTYVPVTASICQTLQELANNSLSASFAIQNNTPFVDPMTQESGSACTLSVTGNGAQFSDPGMVLGKLVNGFQGFEEKTAYQAGGPTGAATAMTRDSALLLINVHWAPAAGVTCPSDQPISECELTPEQKVYAITVQAAMK